MKKEFLLPIYEVIFKFLFGDERNKDILIDFLKAVLKIPHDEYDSVAISDPHLLREFKGDKLGILDIKLKLKSGTTINIEIQLAPMIALRNRLIYYLSKMTTEQIGDGDKYHEINPSISIVILNHILIPESEKYYHHFTYNDLESGVVFSNLQELHTLELPKLPTQKGKETLLPWMKFFSIKSEEELHMVVAEYPQMEKVATKYLEVTQSDRARALHEAKIKQERDAEARAEAKFEEVLSNAVSQAVSQAVSKTQLEERHSMAKSMLLKKMPLDIISEISGLSIEELERIEH